MWNRKLLSGVALALLAFATACNRGSRPAQIGRPAPEFTITDGARQVRLADYRGRVVVLNFWATWCGPCVAEMPSMLALHRAMPEVAILAVSVDEDEAAYRSFLARRHVDLITVRDAQQTAARLYRSDMWPESYVIDRQGVIRRKFVGAQDWMGSEIRAYLQSL